MVLLQGCQGNATGDLTSLEKAEFAIESILSWLKHMGCKSYPQAGKLLISAEAEVRKELLGSSEGIRGQATVMENNCQPGF